MPEQALPKKSDPITGLCEASGGQFALAKVSIYLIQFQLYSKFYADHWNLPSSSSAVSGLCEAPGGTLSSANASRNMVKFLLEWQIIC